jgi:menaquinone-dependent protoporphyrinogen oxidase
MTVLVAYASRHGATQGIAERIAAKLGDAGRPAEAIAVKDVADPTPYEAFVIGSAVYMFHWLKEATKFVHRHHELLAGRPVWLFSSGPLGTDTVDKQGRDLVVVSQAKEVAGIAEAVHARHVAMFYGAYSRGAPVGLVERFVATMPAARDAMPEGDYRDWATIESWASGIARELQGTTTPGPETT